MQMDTSALNADPELVAQIADAVETYLRDRGGLQVARCLRNWPDEPATLPEFERGTWQTIADMGWLGMLVPTQLGGLGLGPVAAVEVARAVGRWVAPEPYTTVAGIVATLLVETQAQSLLDDVVSGQKLIGVALSDDAVGSDAGGERMPCEFIEAPDGMRIQGEQRYCTPIDPADGWLVSARDRDGSLLIVHVPADAQGVTWQRVTTVDGRALARLKFDSVPARPAWIVARGDAAESALRKATAMGRLLTAAELVGCATRLLDLTLAYIAQRKQFGKPIGSFQVLQHRCVDVRIQLDLAEACLVECTDEIQRVMVASDNVDATDAIERAAIRAKVRAAKTAFLASQTAVQLHGAMGITDECDVGLYSKRVLALMPRLGNTRTLLPRWLELTNDSAPQQESPTWLGQFPRTADWNAMSDAQFRAMVRAFLHAHYPEHLRYMPRRVHWSEIRDWYGCLSKQGWIAPAWPQQHGGMGLPPAKLIAWIEEFESHGVARAPDQGIVMVGPVLMRYGNDAQRERFLPRILSGENIWCQGYSEPNAGSDLASLRTQAVLLDDHFVVTGQKIWTTLAQDATHIFLLVRTDKEAKPQAGISFLLCDLASPGITVRPIRDTAGHSEFCEVFFDAVQVPRENLVGNLNQGWDIAKALLGFERVFLGSPKQSQYALGQLRTMARSLGLLGDSAFVSAYADLALDVADLAALYGRYAGYVKRGEPLPPSVSMLKVWATETYQRIGATMAQWAGESAAIGGAVELGGVKINLLAPLFNANAATIYGGANEIQRNILAKAVLGLPG